MSVACAAASMPGRGTWIRNCRAIDSDDCCESARFGSAAHLETAPNDLAQRAERRPPARHLWRPFAKDAVPEAGAPGAASRYAPVQPRPKYSCAFVCIRG